MDRPGGLPGSREQQCRLRDLRGRAGRRRRLADLGGAVGDQHQVSRGSEPPGLVRGSAMFADGAPGRIRTADAGLRTAALYPLSYGGATCILPRGTTARAQIVPSPRMPSDMAATPRLPDLVLYSRPGCHLCDDARAAIQSILEDRAAHGLPLAVLRERDIATEPDIEQAYFDTIPVVE